MAGNVREWCLNPYRVNENLFRPADGRPSYQQIDDSLAVPERPVRGGAHIDGNLPFPAAVRGGLQPAITSPVIGFRLVIAPIQ
jgi:formylglycine-generating enzyme required for sulfatase activity